MRFMILVKSDKSSEAGVMPSRELVTAMGKFNEEMAAAGALVAAEGLHPSARGARVRFSGAKRSVTDGPFPETNQLLAGFWMIKTRSKQEAVDWASRAPFGDGVEVEVRQVFEVSDFPPETLPPAEAAREQALREKLERR